MKTKNKFWNIWNLFTGAVIKNNQDFKFCSISKQHYFNSHKVDDPQSNLSYSTKAMPWIEFDTWLNQLKATKKVYMIDSKQTLWKKVIWCSQKKSNKK